MNTIRKIALGYSVVLLAAASLNYIPGVPDENGIVFGIFALDPFDDALHLASALWALVAAMLGGRASRNFLILFGILYLADGVLGYFTGYGFLDFGIFTNPSEGTSITLLRLLANLPHIGLGGFALWAAFRSGGQ